MLVIKKLEYKRKPKKTETAPAALMLTNAAFDIEGPLVLLTFDRAADFDGTDVGQFQVFDGDFSLRSYIGTGTPTLVTPNMVRVMLQELNPIGPGNVSMTVGAENGIVATDGGAWAGVNDLALPYEAP